MIGMLARLRREDRGDIIVTPAILALLAVTTLVLGGVTYFATRSVAPSVMNSRQGITLDDEGNVVEGALGVVPVETEEPEPTPSPTPRIVEHTTVVEEEPAHTQQPRGGVVIVNPTDNGHTQEGTTSTHNSGDDSSDDGHNDEKENCCEEEPAPPDPH